MFKSLTKHKTAIYKTTSKGILVSNDPLLYVKMLTTHKLKVSNVHDYKSGHPKIIICPVCRHNTAQFTVNRPA